MQRIGDHSRIQSFLTNHLMSMLVAVISFIVYGILSIGIVLLINKFIVIWIGNDYLLSMSICIALGFNFYVDGMRFVNYTYRNTLGLFKKGRMTPLISSISNVVLSIILVHYIGMFGVLISTGLTRLFILTIYDPYLIHKNEFKTSCFKYYKKYSTLPSLCQGYLYYSLAYGIIIKGEIYG